MVDLRAFCLNLDLIAWIRTIWQNLGQNRPQRRQRPKDGAGGGGGRYVRTDFPCVLQDLLPPGPLPIKKKREILKD